MRLLGYARPAVLIAGGWVSFALALIGGRELDLMGVEIMFMVGTMLVLPVLAAVLLMWTGPPFRVYAVAAAVVVAGCGLVIAASVSYGFPRFLLVLAVTFAVAAALPDPPVDRTPAWTAPAVLVAGTVVVFATLAPTLAWRSFPDSLRVCVRPPADAERLAHGSARPLHLGRGVQSIDWVREVPGCLDVSYEWGTPQARVDHVYGRLRRNPDVVSVHKRHPV